MVMREKDYLRRPDKYFHKVYNAGKADIGVKERLKDEFGTPIGRSEFQSKLVMWYRNLGITADDSYYARAEGTEVERKIAIKGYRDINTQWHVKLTNKTYAIHRVYYNPKDDETELTLFEVIL